MRIKDYPQTDTLEPSDVFVIDGNKGTGCITSADMGIVTTDDPAVSHRNVFRGKNLGDVFTEAQKKAIKDGTFDDLYVGDYWEINGNKWLIADINYWLKKLDSPYPRYENHLLVLPENILYKTPFNETKNLSTGYLNSDIRATGLSQAKTTIYNIFGSENILKYQDLLSNAVTNGYVTGNVSTEVSIELMTSPMVLGYAPWPQLQGTTYSRHDSVLERQVQLFNLCPYYIASDASYSLSDISGQNYITEITVQGRSLPIAPSAEIGVRPCFGVTG